MPRELVFQKRHIKGCVLRYLVRCRVCEHNYITQRINYINICDEELCIKTATEVEFRYPDPPFRIIES
jgi:hypothetical protein